MNSNLTERSILETLEILENSQSSRCSKLFRFDTAPFYREVAFVSEPFKEPTVRIVVEGIPQGVCKSKGEILDLLLNGKKN